MTPALFKSTRMDWCTPEAVLELVRRIDPIGLDPCSGPGSIVGAAKEYMADDDGLAQSWTGHGLVFFNPPYGRSLRAWMRKAADESVNGAEIVALVPARPDTAWFQYAWRAKAICFWSGRLTFLGAPHPAPFPSAAVYYGPRRHRFAEVFQGAGMVVFP